MSKLYAVKDNTIGFETAYCMPNNASAIRQFGDIVKKEGTRYNVHPEDYDLYYLGDFDDNTGEIKPEVTFLERAKSFLS